MLLFYDTLITKAAKGTTQYISRKDFKVIGQGIPTRNSTHPKVLRLETFDPSVRAADLMEVLEKCVQIV